MAAFCVSGGIRSGEIQGTQVGAGGEEVKECVWGWLYWMMVQEKFPGDQTLVRPSRLRNEFRDSSTSYLIYCITNKFLLKNSWLTVLCWFQAYSSVIQFHIYTIHLLYTWLPWWLSSREFACSMGDLGLIPGNPLQCSCLGNRMDKRAWRATVYGVAKVGHNLVTGKYIYMFM